MDGSRGDDRIGGDENLPSDDTLDEYVNGPDEIVVLPRAIVSLRAIVSDRTKAVRLDSLDANVLARDDGPLGTTRRGLLHRR